MMRFNLLKSATDKYKVHVILQWFKTILSQVGIFAIFSNLIYQYKSTSAVQCSAVVHVSNMQLSFLSHDFDYGLHRLPDQHVLKVPGLTAGMHNQMTRDT
jgi:hypothetical protein